MQCLLSEISKIQGERQADERIKACLLELYTRQQSIMDNMCFQSEDCNCETEGKPLVEVLGDEEDDEQTKIITDS